MFCVCLCACLCVCVWGERESVSGAFSLCLSRARMGAKHLLSRFFRRGSPPLRFSQKYQPLGSKDKEVRETIFGKSTCSAVVSLPSGSPGNAGPALPLRQLPD